MTELSRGERRRRRKARPAHLAAFLGLSGLLLASAACSSGAPATSSATASVQSQATGPTPDAAAPTLSSSGPSATTAGAPPSPSASSQPPPAPTPPSAPPSAAPKPSPTAYPNPSALVARYAGKIATTLPGSQKRVALTFDGGADARGAERIVATLRAAGVPASFFVTGKFAQANPALVATLASIGPVGNHTWDHPHLPTLSPSATQSQLDRARAQIIAVGGGSGMPFFRFPFGESNPATLSAVNAAGYVAVGWTVDSLGWQGTSGGQTVAKVADRVVAAQRPGEIVLMHLGGHPTDKSTLDADALPQIISRLKASGYTFVTLDALGS